MFSKPPRPLPLVAGVILAMLVGVTSAAAQSSTLSSGIEGRVTDDSGGALPGVVGHHQEPGAAGAAARDRLRRRRAVPLRRPSGRHLRRHLPARRLQDRHARGLARRRQLRRHHRREAWPSASSKRPSPSPARRRSSTSAAPPSSRTSRKRPSRLLPTSRSYEDIGKLAPGIRVVGHPGRRRQQDRRRPRHAGQLRIEQRRLDADARRRQHRRHGRLLRHGRGRGDDRPARRQRSRDSDARHGVPGHRQVRRQHLQGRRALCLAGPQPAEQQHRRRAARRRA